MFGKDLLPRRILLRPQGSPADDVILKIPKKKHLRSAESVLQTFLPKRAGKFSLGIQGVNMSTSAPISAAATRPASGICVGGRHSPRGPFRTNTTRSADAWPDGGIPLTTCPPLFTPANCQYAITPLLHSRRQISRTQESRAFQASWTAAQIGRREGKGKIA